MSSDTIATGVGYFGKVPQRGDFIQDQLPTDFATNWSEWLQAGLAVSREQLEESWSDYYMTSPIWHFALSPHVCGERAMIGSLMPSIDSVGRKFYFSIAVAVQHPPILYWENRSWSEQAESHILNVLDDEIDLAEWVIESQQASWYQSIGHDSSPLQVINESHEHSIIVNPVDVNQLLHHAYQQRYGRYCLWWTNGSEHVQECSLVTRGLPLVSQFSALLDGRWKKWGW